MSWSAWFLRISTVDRLIVAIVSGALPAIVSATPITVVSSASSATTALTMFQRSASAALSWRAVKKISLVATGPIVSM